MRPGWRSAVVGLVGTSALVIGGVVATFADIPGEARSTVGVAEAPSTRQGETVPITCGGYDETGALVRPEAAAISHARVGHDGRPIIPDVCGGYDAGGFFVGDD
jgi:hypothetical protein